MDPRQLSESKSEQLKSFKALEAAFERQASFKVKCLRSDGGGEYTSKKAQNYLKMNGIRWERTAPRTPSRMDALNGSIGPSWKWLGVSSLTLV
jgi:hypothetical protein